MSGFSGALKLTDLDDFITPSQVIYPTIYLKISFKFFLFNPGMHQTSED